MLMKTRNFVQPRKASLEPATRYERIEVTHSDIYECRLWTLLVIHQKLNFLSRIKFEVKTRKIPIKESACACLLGLMEALACCIGLRSYSHYQRAGNERQNF